MNSSKQPTYTDSFGGGSSYKQIKDYTYFDSNTKRYFDRRKKNQVKRQQNLLEKERKELARCTFRPMIQSRNYQQLSRKVQKIKEEMSDSKQKPEKQKKNLRPERRLLEWGKEQEIKKRKKIVQKQLELINLTKSLSKQKIIRKMNRSLQQIARSKNKNDSFLKSIKAVPIVSKEQLFNKPTYKTLQYSRRNK